MNYIPTRILSSIIKDSYFIFYPGKFYFINSLLLYLHLSTSSCLIHRMFFSNILHFSIFTTCAMYSSIHSRQEAPHTLKTVPGRISMKFNSPDSTCSDFSTVTTVPNLYNRSTIRIKILKIYIVGFVQVNNQSQRLLRTVSSRNK